MKKIIASPHAPKAVGPYSQAVEANGTLYISGQLPIDASTGKMPDTIEEQTRQALTNLAHIAAEAGYTLDDAVKATVLLDDMGDFGAMNGVCTVLPPADARTRMLRGGQAAYGRKGRDRPYAGALMPNRLYQI